MNTQEFLTHIWPSEGPYCILKTFIGSDGEEHFHQTSYDHIRIAAKYAVQESKKTNVFFCVHTLIDKKTWNPTALNRKTGETGKWVVKRTQENMKETRAFFFDLDVGESTETVPKFKTREQAGIALKKFCKEAKLPKPTVVSSGGGYHVYWPLSRPIPALLWKDYSNKLHHIGVHTGMQIDPSRTTDEASILRPVGTMNRKPGRDATDVELVVEGGAIFVDEMLQSIDAAVENLGVEVLKKVVKKREFAQLNLKGKMADVWTTMPGNITDDFDPIPLQKIVDNCALMEHFVAQNGNVSEPQWYHGMGVVRFAENGDEEVHNVSKGYPGYSYDEVEAKVEQHRHAVSGATSCHKLGEVFGTDKCQDCPLFNKGRTPLYAATHAVAPAPEATFTHMIGGVPVAATLPPPPKKYTRTKMGIKIKTKDDDGNEGNEVICAYDMYPVQLSANTSQASQSTKWQATLPRGRAPAVFDVTADVLFDGRELPKLLHNHGVVLDSHNVKKVQGYMSAYIRELQAAVDDEVEFDHFGWTEDGEGFVLADKVIYKGGKVRPATLVADAANVIDTMAKKGTLEKQIEILKFYNKPIYLPHQFFILASLATPIFYATGHEGVILGATGLSGASKSTALFTGASFWGMPKHFALNGMKTGSTALGRLGRLNMLSNLPGCLDELTGLEGNEFQTMALSVSQGGGRIGMKQDGTERRVKISTKANMMLVSSNTPLYPLLTDTSAASDAAAMRVFEIPMVRVQDETMTKAEAKTAAEVYLRELNENCGHIGEQFLLHWMQDADRYEKMVHDKMAELNRTGDVDQGERIWGGAAAAIFVAGKLAYEWGLVPFNIAEVERWFLGTQLNVMRSTIKSARRSELDVLSDYMEFANDQILVIGTMNPNLKMVDSALRVPRGKLSARHEMATKKMYISRSSLQQYCDLTKASYHQMLKVLSVPVTVDGKAYPPVITERDTRKMLGAGTDMAKGRTRCVEVNLNHPLVSDMVPELAASTEKPEASDKGKPDLKVV